MEKLFSKNLRILKAFEGNFEMWGFPICLLVFLWSWGLNTRALCIPGKPTTTEPHPQGKTCVFKYSFLSDCSAQHFPQRESEVKNWMYMRKVVKFAFRNRVYFQASLGKRNPQNRLLFFQKSQTAFHIPIKKINKQERKKRKALWVKFGYLIN